MNAGHDCRSFTPVSTREAHTRPTSHCSILYIQTHCLVLSDILGPKTCTPHSHFNGSLVEIEAVIPRAPLGCHSRHAIFCTHPRCLQESLRLIPRCLPAFARRHVSTALHLCPRPALRFGTPVPFPPATVSFHRSCCPHSEYPEARHPSAYSHGKVRGQNLHCAIVMDCWMALATIRQSISEMHFGVLEHCCENLLQCPILQRNCCDSTTSWALLRRNTAC